MRKLTIRQKKYLDKLYKEFDIRNTYDLTPEQYDTLNEINCFENMDTEIDRYLSDKHFGAGNTYSAW